MAAAVLCVEVSGVVVRVADTTEQVRVDDRGTAAVEARVRHVDGEPEGGSESLRHEPRVVPRTARCVAGQVAGNDLGAPLVMKLRHSGRLDRHNRRVGRERAHLCCAQVQELGVDLGDGEVGSDLFSGSVRLAAGVRAGGAGHRLHGHAPARRAALDLVRGTQGGGRAHRRVGAHQLGHAVERVSRGVNDVGVLGGVAEHGRAGAAQLGEPLGLDRTHELDEHERLAAVRRLLARQRGPRRRVHLAAGQQHFAHVVAAGGAGAAKQPVVLPCGLDQIEVAISRDHARVRALERELRARGIRHHEQMCGGVRARRFGARQGRAGY